MLEGKNVSIEARHTRRGRFRRGERARSVFQGYLLHKKQTAPLGPPQGPMHEPTVESYGQVVSHEPETTVISVQVLIVVWV